jgi:hypothetical protein
VPASPTGWPWRASSRTPTAASCAPSSPSGPTGARFELSLPKAPERVADDTHPRGWQPDLGHAARASSRPDDGGPAMTGERPPPGGIALTETVAAERLHL